MTARRAMMVCVSVAFALGACDAETPAGDAALDAAADATVEPRCAADADCSDGTFCNGAERCDPAAEDADARGCVAADGPACMSGQTCDEEGERCETECPVTRDADGDGFDAIECGGADCDDTAAGVNPGAAEVCDPDDVDEDCDPSTFGVRDADGDDEPDMACCNPDPEGGEPSCGTDCDDTRAGVSPTVSETCNERDDDCDGGIDEDVLDTYYPDLDSDDFGDPDGTPIDACFQPAGYAARPTDCDDTRSGVNPGLGERCDELELDENCDGIVNPDSLCMCIDGAAQPCTLPGACAAGTETCADGAWGECSIAAVGETCNGVDDDCDGAEDEGLTVVCYVDGDNDGYAAGGAASSDQCPDPLRTGVGGCPNFFTNRPPSGGNVDCEDSEPSIRPTATEVCNGLDDDCDGEEDELIRVACYADVDNDTYAPSGASSLLCPVPDRTAVGGCPLGTTDRVPSVGATDCDDGASAVRPSATEVCTGGVAIDDDCDGDIDEDVAVSCYADTDGDTYAPSGAGASMQCRDASRSAVGFCPIAYTNRMPSGTVFDCAPTDAAIHPGASESCAGAPAADEDCDGEVNEGCTCVDGNVRGCTLPGVCSTGTEQCEGGAWGACSTLPVTEICDGRDEDCDGTVDDGLTVTCYPDGDNDTYASSGASATASCPVAGREAVGGCPVGSTNRAPTGSAIDCDDMSSAIHPAATEVCSDSGTPVDEDCDDDIDEMLRSTCYADGDSDTYAPTSSSATSRCRDASRPLVGFCPAGYTDRAPGAGATDCNDGASGVNPGVSEVCDRIDSNCSSGGEVALDEDFDEDMHAPIGAACTAGYPADDCDDAAPAVHPGATELCDRVDSNCSSGGGADLTEDNDGDGHAPSGTLVCSGGFPANDCLDTNASVYGGQTAYFGTPYCTNGSTAFQCTPGSASGWYCGGAGACPPVCAGCAPIPTAAWDYDCSGGISPQPFQTCTTSVGEACFGSVCRSGPVDGAGTEYCGQSVSYRTCTCSFTLECSAWTASTRGFGCR